ncbi:MAG: ligase-associated DNA damage response DEXH box helicase [Pseudomonadota bacterium]|nr:ligase-associated DNA damage response DEXH box helicase [Pseudomonadota bacterium]
MAFQEEAWAAYLRGESGIVQVPTGAGKTYAAYLGPLAEVAALGGGVLYISPLRAMARDIEAALKAPVEALGMGVRVESRTGDTSSAVRVRQKARLPEVLVTTPESLSLLLTEADAATRFAGLRAVIVDEWHEMIDSKRGTQIELALSRLRRFAPTLRTWALTATVGNAQEAAQAAVGTHATATIVRADIPRPVVIDTLLPDRVDAFPWAGHLGLQMAPKLVEALDPEVPTLVFVNTRAQAERWYQEILARRPEWTEHMALHHGSVDREERERVEAGLKCGSLRLVVCTASLDLGVDLTPIERVVQIGSPKGIARLTQRAGRSGHRPGATCRVTCVPTNTFELVEIAAVRDALAHGEVEARTPLSKPLDALAQHLVTCALGGGFTEEGILAEVRGAWSYRGLTAEELGWALALVRDGGATLGAYPEYHRVVWVDDRYGVPDDGIARTHRSNVGTILGDATMQVRLQGGANIGSIDEGFITRLRPGERFVFAGRTLELVRIKELVAYARPAGKATTNTPHWPGNKLPISGSLGHAVRRVLNDVREGRVDAPELVAAAPVFAAQASISRLPAADHVLAEQCVTREGHHLFLYPFEGRRVHEGLAALLALRMGRRVPATFSMAVNDHGLELLTSDAYPYAELLDATAFTLDGLVDDIIASVNISELMRRRFREIARVAGLVMTGPAHARRTMRQIQSSTSLLYDVFTRYDPGNLLLLQARREVVEQQFERDRLQSVLARLGGAALECIDTSRPSPLAFPLVVERLAVDAASMETLMDRIERMKRQWESA